MSRVSPIKQFEATFCKVFGFGNAVAVCNGTAAIETGLEALNLRPGQVVITTPFTFPSTVSSILRLGGRPHFVDIDPDTYCLDATLVPEAINTLRLANTRIWGVLAVHLFGNMVDVRTLDVLCYEESLHLLEDASQALGATSDGDYAGGFGDVGTFSFYATKPLSTYEGGMLVTHKDEVAMRARQIINHGLDEYGDIVRLGTNRKMPELLAFIGDTKLRLHLTGIMAELNKDTPYNHPDIYGRLVTDHPIYKSLKAHCPVAESVAAEVRASIKT